MDTISECVRGCGQCGCADLLNPDIIPRSYPHWGIWVLVSRYVGAKLLELNCVSSGVAFYWHKMCHCHQVNQVVGNPVKCYLVRCSIFSLFTHVSVSVTLPFVL